MPFNFKKAQQKLVRDEKQAMMNNFSKWILAKGLD